MQGAGGSNASMVWHQFYGISKGLATRLVVSGPTKRTVQWMQLGWDGKTWPVAAAWLEQGNPTSAMSATPLGLLPP